METDLSAEKRLRVEPYLKAASVEAAGTNSYKGLRIHSLPGLHEFIARLILEIVPAGRRLLDLAAGAGAFSARCNDLGYKMTAADAVGDNFRAGPEVAFCTADLDQDFSGIRGCPFDAIAAIEIIEHLENPRHFFRTCHKLVVPGGLLIVTTPNIGSPVSKAMFCRIGRPQWFLDRDYRQQGHITPLADWQLKQCASEAGFVTERLTSFGAPYRMVENWWRMRLFARLIQALDPAASELQGEILIGVFRKV